jgi:hypothetical protein
MDGHTEAPDLDSGGRAPLVAGIEGRLVRSHSRSWVASVLGIHGDERWWWIQVAPEDDASASIVVRCSHHAKPDHITALLRTWQPSTALSLRVMSVMA